MNTEIFFEPPPKHLELVNGEAHIFCAELEGLGAPLERFEKILSDDERARAARFILARDRNRFVAARGMLREILGWLLRAGPERLVFAYGEHGKPQMAAPVAGRFLHFNLAHSDALAVCIVSAQAAVGVDVERIRSVREAEMIAAQFFSASEFAEWRSLPAAKQDGAFFEFWTRKEALLKASGLGLGGLNQIQVQPKSDSAKGAFGLSNFSVHQFTPASGYKAAAASKNVRAPHFWKWPAR